jgi:hypothetical protein
MSFNYSKEFDVYVVLSATHIASPWLQVQWLQTAGLLEPFASSTRGKTALRTMQFPADSRKPISFGRLGWDARSHNRWTLDSTGGGEEFSAERVFLSTEAWAPAWTQCAKDGEPPDFFLSLHNARPGAAPEALCFGAILIIALSALEADDRRMRLRTAVKAIAKQLESPISVFKRRSWGKQVGTVGFTAALNDLGVVGLFKRGDCQRRPLDLYTFADQWAPLEA